MNDIEQKLKKRSAIIGTLMIAVFCIVCYAGYQRFSQYTKLSQNTYQTSLADLNAQFQKQIASTELKFNQLDNKIANTLAKNLSILVDSSTESDNQILKDLDDQNKLILQMLKYSDFLDKEIKKLRQHVNAISLGSPSANSEFAKTSINLEKQIAPTLEELEKEVSQSDQESLDTITKIENEFIQKSQDTYASIISSEQIENAINLYQTENNTKLNPAMIDCRESMCKIKFDNLKNEDVEIFGMQLLTGLPDEMNSYFFTENRDINSDGSTNVTYYLTIE